jgi:hypothetical protein
MIQKIGNANEEGRLPRLQAIIGDSSRQMGFATAAWSHKHKPSLRVRCKGGGCPISADKSLLIGGIIALTMQYQVIESETGQGAQVAVGLQSGKAIVLQLLLRALTRYQLAVIRPTGRQPGMQESCSFAVGTGGNFFW